VAACGGLRGLDELTLPASIEKQTAEKNSKEKIKNSQRQMITSITIKNVATYDSVDGYWRRN
jgi:hypothetical protein